MMKPSDIAIEGAWVLAQLILDTAVQFSPFFALAVVVGAVVGIGSAIDDLLNKKRAADSAGKDQP
jgi:hypothetical protein